MNAHERIEEIIMLTNFKLWQLASSKADSLYEDFIHDSIVYTEEDENTLFYLLGVIATALYG